MTDRKPLVHAGDGEVEQLQEGDFIELPATDEGQILFSAEGTTFERVHPLLNDAGEWLCDEDFDKLVIESPGAVVITDAGIGVTDDWGATVGAT